MKRIVCEMCGSHGFMKADGMMVCQGCGTKYTTEEAKKMMVEVEGEAAPVTLEKRNQDQRDRQSLYRRAQIRRNRRYGQRDRAVGQGKIGGPFASIASAFS